MGAPAEATVQDFVAAFAAAASDVAEEIAGCDMGAAVPTCPGWSAYDLVVHLGNIHGWAATITETCSSAPDQDDRPASRRPKAVARWYAAKAEDLYSVLRDLPLDAPCWTLSREGGTRGFWARRQTHETYVHLVDLCQVSGRTPDVPAVLAADGVAEVLEVFLPRMHRRGRPARLEAPVLLSAQDTGDTWLVSPRVDGAPRFRRVDAADLVEGDTDLVAAPALDLLLLLWKRLTPWSPGVTLDGDRDRLLDFLASPLTP